MRHYGWDDAGAFLFQAVLPCAEFARPLEQELNEQAASPGSHHAGAVEFFHARSCAIQSDAASFISNRRHALPNPVSPNTKAIASERGRVAWISQPFQLGASATGIAVVALRALLCKPDQRAAEEWAWLQKARRFIRVERAAANKRSETDSHQQVNNQGRSPVLKRPPRSLEELKAKTMAIASQVLGFKIGRQGARRSVGAIPALRASV